MPRRQTIVTTHIVAGLRSALAPLIDPPAGAVDTPSLDLPALDPRHLPDLVAKASSHLVLPMLSPPVNGHDSNPPSEATAAPKAIWPAELPEFLAGIRRANDERNRKIVGQIAEAGAILDRIGIPVVALKGAAELLHPNFPERGMRFLSDIDLLVPADKAADAQAALIAQGYQTPFADIAVVPGHHLPVLVWPGGHNAVHRPANIELHRRAMASTADGLIDADDLIAGARPVAGHTVRCPDLATRMIHLIAHAQIEDGHFRSRRIRLREIAEFAALNTGLDDTGRDAVANRFRKGGFHAEYLGFVAAADRLLGPLPGVPQAAGSGAAEAWAAAAVRHLSRSGRLQVAYLARWSADIARGLTTSRQSRRRAWRVLSERAVLRASLVARWRHLQGLR